MVFTKNYYAILGLETPNSLSSTSLSQQTLRKAYKAALLSAHPDKATSAQRAQIQTTGRTDEKAWTVDDVKEALAVLSDGERRHDFDRWVVGNAQARTGLGTASATATGAAADEEDFVLGLELLDLSDFEAGLPGFVRLASAPGSPAEEAEGSVSPERGTDAETEAERDGEDGGQQMEWTRACRCGAEKGFRILEKELEDAEERGEREVLVGCEGCSLWVRVEFDIEEG